MPDLDREPSREPTTRPAPLSEREVRQAIAEEGRSLSHLHEQRMQPYWEQAAVHLMRLRDASIALALPLWCVVALLLIIALKMWLF